MARKKIKLKSKKTRKKKGVLPRYGINLRFEVMRNVIISIITLPIRFITWVGALLLQGFIPLKHKQRKKR